MAKKSDLEMSRAIDSMNLLELL